MAASSTSPSPAPAGHQAPRPNTAGTSARSARMSEPPLGAIGMARPRVEGTAKVTGAVRSAADEPMSEPAHGWVVTSTVTRGRIRDINTSAALAMPGVLGVLDHNNAPRLNLDAGSFTPAGRLRWWWRRRRSRPGRRPWHCG